MSPRLISRLLPGLILLSPVAAAQVIQTTPPVPAGPPPVSEPAEKIERTPDAAGGLSGLPGVAGRAIRPGVFLITGFDADRDGDVTASELRDGAEHSFRLADANASGSVDGFEQTAWARTAGGGDEVLANVMLFDTNLDQQVTHAEFTEGVMRLAAPMRTAGDGAISLASLKARPPTTPLQARPFVPIAGR